MDRKIKLEHVICSTDPLPPHHTPPPRRPHTHPLTQKFIFIGKFDKFNEFGTFLLKLLCNKSLLLQVNVRYTAGWVANSVDPD